MDHVSVIIQCRHYPRAKHYLDGYQVYDYWVESLEDDIVRLTLERTDAVNLIASLPSGSVKVER